MQAKIEKKKTAISELEKKLRNSSSIISIFSPLDENDLKETLFQHRMDLIKLYKSDNQFDEAMKQLKIVYEFLNNPKNKSFYPHQTEQNCIEVLVLQIECSNANAKEQKVFLDDILIRLSLISHNKYKKDISEYLRKYVTLATKEEALKKTSEIISNLDKSSFTDSSNYKCSLNLKIDLLCDLNDFPSAYEQFINLIEHYESLKMKRPSTSTHYLSQEELATYLNMHSLTCLKDLPSNEKAEKIVGHTLKEQYIDCTQYKVISKSTNKQENKQSLRELAVLYYHLKITPPKWFPKYEIKQLDLQSLFQNDHYEKDNSFRRKEQTDFTQTIDTYDEVAIIPEHEKIKEKITLGWDKHGVAGYRTEIKKLVEQLFLPRALSPEQLEKMALKLPRGGILYGPPGTGKTLMARTIANYFFEKENVTIINGPTLISKYVGQSAENLRNILEVAKRNPNRTHVVIIDEIDALVGSRTHAEGVANQIKSDLTTTILTYLDGVNIIDNLMIIGLTNYFERLDEALIRPGRLDVHINIDLPNLEDRFAILELYLSELQQKNIVDQNIDIDLFAKKSEGLSGAGIKAFIDNTVKSFALSQVVRFEKDSLKIDDINKIKPLCDPQFLVCLENILVTVKQKKSEQEILLSRPFCQYSSSLYQQWLSIRKMADQFTYLNPMIIGISGASGTGSTTFALNLFHEFQPNCVYMKAEELVNLAPKEQKKLIDDYFSKALLKEHGILIIDDLEDMSSCNCSPVIYLRNKLKMVLPEGETLKIILISKKENTVDTLFKNQIYCDAIINMPCITQKEEVISLIQILGLDLEFSHTDANKIKNQIPISKLKTALLTYYNKVNPEKIKIDAFIDHLNSLHIEHQKPANRYGLFQKGSQEEFPLTLEMLQQPNVSLRQQQFHSQ